MHACGGWHNSVPHGSSNWGPEFSAGCCLEAAFNCLPLCRAVHKIQSKQVGESKRECVSKIEVTIFYNLILKVTAHHFCCILFVRSNTPPSQHTYTPHTHTYTHTHTELHRSMNTRDHWEPLRGSLPYLLIMFIVCLSSLEYKISWGQGSLFTSKSQTPGTVSSTSLVFHKRFWMNEWINSH